MQGFSPKKFASLVIRFSALSVTASLKATLYGWPFFDLAISIISNLLTG
jgi:hypothetical protein